MEDDGKLLSLPPYPCLAFIRGNDRELLTLCPIEENGGVVVEKNTPDHLLDHNHIWNCCHGWLILSDAEEIHYSLWSPAETIHLPALPLNSEQEIGYCILTSPPGNSDSMVVLLEITGPSFFYCKVGDQQWTWTEQQEKEYPVMLEGRILFCTKNMGQVQGVGTIDIKPDRLAFSFLDLEPPSLDVPWEHLKEYLVESCGEIFSITLRLNGDYEWNEVIAVYAFKLDSSRREWERVQSFKDRAFFLGSFQFSCPATQTGIKGNHVYFQLSNDPTLYSYNMEDGTVLFSMPCPNLSDWSTSFWVIQNLGRLSKDAGGEIKSDVPDDAGDEIKSKNREIVKHCTIEQADFDKLPLEILTKIGRCLGWQDYMRFRAVNTRFRSAAPIQRWRNGICLPWLISWRLGDSIWDFVDPLHEGRYFMTSNKELEDITALTCYPKGDWCVMFHGQDSVFLWNPFSKKTIQLPNLQLPNVRIDFNCDTLSVAGCNFSSSPDSLESDCTIVVLFNLWVEYRINFINLGGKEWKSYSFRHNGGIKLYKDNPLVFYNGAVYFLDENGNLGIYREIGDEEDGEREGGGHVRYGDGDGDEAGDGDGEGEADGHGDEIGDEDEEGDGDEDEDGEEEAEGDGDEIGDEDEDREVLDHVVLSPCKTFHQKFLLKCNGKLLSVFVGFLGEWVEIFSLDENKKVWVEVEDLGNHTICLSRFSAFSMVAPPGLQNRIYFPRFYGKNSVVYYSLESMQLHAHGIDEVLEDFYDTKEQLLCGWITPRFLFTD